MTENFRYGKNSRNNIMSDRLVTYRKDVRKGWQNAYEDVNVTGNNYWYGKTSLFGGGKWTVKSNKCLFFKRNKVRTNLSVSLKVSFLGCQNVQCYLTVFNINVWGNWSCKRFNFMFNISKLKKKILKKSLNKIFSQ